MYIRIVRARAQPGQAEEVARRWQSFWRARMPGMAGFRHAHFAAGHEADTTLAISVWDQRPDQATMESLMAEFRSQLTDISAGPPTVEEYETLADF